VIYEFVPERGLYRQERAWVTADTFSFDLDQNSPECILLAEEVTNLSFAYIGPDGSESSSWNPEGTEKAPDGVGSKGPPRAIRITLTLKITTSKGEVEKQVSQMIAIRAAPGAYTPPLIQAPTDAASETTPADPATGATTTPMTGGATGGMGGMTGGGMGGSTSGMGGGSTGGGVAPSLPQSPTVPPGVSLPGGTGGSTGGGRTGGTPTGGGTTGGGTTGGGRTGGGR
jgi:hypothetical protein